jgi:phosphoserine phosphatase
LVIYGAMHAIYAVVYAGGSTLVERGRAGHLWDDLQDPLVATITTQLAGESTQTHTLEIRKGRIMRYEVHVLDAKRNGPYTLAECSAVAKSQEVRRLEEDFNVQIVVLPSELTKRLSTTPGLAVFDMDSTLIQQEVIDELAKSIGKYDQVAEITEAAMRGELDFEGSLRERVALLHGVPTSIWDDLKAGTISFTPGVRDLIDTLKRHGWKTAVLSGGFTPLANWVKDTLGLDYAAANHLEFDTEQKILTGKLVEGQPIVHAERKRELLLELATTYGISGDNVIAVGDGSNDLKMMGAAALGIAFNAKPKVQAAAPARLASDNMADLLYILGFVPDTSSEP